MGHVLRRGSQRGWARVCVVVCGVGKRQKKKKKLKAHHPVRGHTGHRRSLSGSAAATHPNNCTRPIGARRHLSQPSLTLKPSSLQLQPCSPSPPPPNTPIRVAPPPPVRRTYTPRRAFPVTPPAVPQLHPAASARSTPPRFSSILLLNPDPPPLSSILLLNPDPPPLSSRLLLNPDPPPLSSILLLNPDGHPCPTPSSAPAAPQRGWPPVAPPAAP
eukprot:scaffold12123_cov128-Isochrysis_galbana.AAC.2